jgi:metallophosphoesterase (TIGR03768 family)
MLCLALAGYTDNIFQSGCVVPQPPSYPIDTTVVTTLDRTVTPVDVPSTSPSIFPYELSKYAEFGYGIWKFDDGIGYDKRLDLMPSTYSDTTPTTSVDLLRFFAITDIHLTDKESPAQALYYGYRGLPVDMIGAYSGAMLYTTQFLDATVQTINAINEEKPFDFGISLGDVVNSREYNELRWYIDVLDGQTINPDSGDKDDPIPGLLNDYQDTYKAAGLDKSIPWYQTMGNHDQFWMGIYTPNSYILSSYTGKDILNLGGDVVSFIRSDLTTSGYYMGSIDGRTPYGNILGIGPVADFPDGNPQVLAADPNRRPITRTEWMEEFFNTTSLPVGHGFSRSNIDNNFACYSFVPKWNVPIKVIVLDDTTRSGIGGWGCLDQERYDWLVNELNIGQAEGKLMIIASHIPIGVEPIGEAIGWNPYSTISENTLIAKLHTYPNFILWVAGHRHRNVVTAFKSPDDAHPELGFWQIETSSLREFPQQFRTFDITRNSDNTVSIFATDVDAAIRPGSLAAISRSYAVAAQELFNRPLATTPTGVYNVELIKQLSPQLSDSIAPTVLITAPTTATTITRNAPTINLSGIASDNKAVISLIWENAANGDTGACVYDGASWSVKKITLDRGVNPITITASDAAGNTSTDSISVTYIKTLPGTLWKGLAMVSLPIIPDKTDPKLEVNFYGNSWTSFLPNLNEYSVYPDSRCWLTPAENTPGRGFWARFQSASLPYGNIPDQSQPVSIHLLPGWNLIGNPYISAVKWDLNEITVHESELGTVALKNSEVVYKYAWGWLQNNYDPTIGLYDLVYDSILLPGVTSRLLPWQGYWIKAIKECDLILPAPDVSSVSSVKKPVLR